MTHTRGWIGLAFMLMVIIGAMCTVAVQQRAALLGLFQQKVAMAVERLAVAN